MSNNRGGSFQDYAGTQDFEILADNRLAYMTLSELLTCYQDYITSERKTRNRSQTRCTWHVEMLDKIRNYAQFKYNYKI